MGEIASQGAPERRETSACERTVDEEDEVCPRILHAFVASQRHRASLAVVLQTLESCWRRRESQAAVEAAYSRSTFPSRASPSRPFLSVVPPL